MSNQSRSLAHAELLGFLLSLAVFALLAYQVQHDRVPGWDAAVHRFLTSHEEPVPFSTVADKLINWSLEGGANAVGFLVLLTLAAVLAFRRRFREVSFLGGSVLGAVALTHVLKEVFERGPAGEYAKYSFPSGHAARSTVLAAALILIAWRTRWRWPVTLVCSSVAAVLGASLVYEDWHLPSDVIGAWALALAWIVALRAVVFRVEKGSEDGGPGHTTAGEAIRASRGKTTPG